GWEAVMGRILALDFNEDTGQKPEIGQFQAASPAPYFEQIKGYAQMLAAEAAIPATYLGFVHDNPTSADAIRTAEARLVKRAERRQKVFGAAWLEVARLALLIRDGELPDDFNEVRTAWRDPSTPTRAAATDATVKLVQTGVLPVDSDVTLDQLGFSETDKQRLVQDRRKAQAAANLAALSAVPPARVPGDEPDAGDGDVPPAPGGPAPAAPAGGCGCAGGRGRGARLRRGRAGRPPEGVRRARDRDPRGGLPGDRAPAGRAGGCRDDRRGPGVAPHA